MSALVHLSVMGAGEGADAGRPQAMLSRDQISLTRVCMACFSQGSIPAVLAIGLRRSSLCRDRDERPIERSCTVPAVRRDSVLLFAFRDAGLTEGLRRDRARIDVTSPGSP